jgi:hypothetical protein
MTPYEAYKLYTAIKNHFSSPSYDFFKYNGKIRATQHSFETRSDKYMFYKLSKREDPLGYLVANLSDDPKLWIGSLFDKEHEEKYNNYLKRQQSLAYLFKQDLGEMLDEFDKNFEVPPGHYPYLLNLLLRKKIMKETFIIINDCVRFAGAWNKRIEDPILWPQIVENCKKYSPFLSYDKDKYCTMLRDHFS